MMNPIAFFKKIKLTIEQIDDPYEFGDFDADSFHFIFNRVKEILDEEDSYFRFTINEGCTKGVLIPINGSFVFKIPFDFDVNCWTRLSLDYCDKEVDHYHQAKDAGLEFVFVKTVFFDELENKFGGKLPVYIQDKVHPFTDKCSTDEPTYRELSSKYSNTNRLAPAWVEDFCNLYGVDSFDSLGTFVDKVGINDLHSNNIGYYKNKPVIFDYSGFFDGSDDFTSYYIDCNL